MENDLNLKPYLDDLDRYAPLKKDAELEILKRIEAKQTEIIRTCMAHALFKAETLKVLKRHAKMPIEKVTRHITPKTSEKDKLKYADTYNELLADFIEGKEITERLLEFSLSANVIFAIVERITKKNMEIAELKQEIKRALLFFDCYELSQAVKLAKAIEKSMEVTKYYCLKFRVSESKLIARCAELKVLNKAAKRLALTGFDSSDSKELFTKLHKITKEMRADRDTLIIHNLRLVVSRARIYKNRGLELEDLISEGNLGLIKAVEKHDSSRGVKVATYATWWIDQSIRRALSNKAKLIRIPTHVENLELRASTTVTEFTKLKGRVPTKEELSELLQVDIKEIERLDFTEFIQVESVGPESTTSIFESLGDETQTTPEDALALSELKQKVRGVLAKLEPKAEKIVRMRFGIGEGYEESTLESISNEVGMTKVGVHRAVKRALKLVKKEL